MTPSSRLIRLMIAGLLLAVLPILLHPGLWVVVVGLWCVLGSLTLLEWLLLFGSKPRVTLKPPKAVGVGEEFKLKTRLEWPLRRPLRCRVRAEVSEPILPGPDVELTVKPGHNDFLVPLEVPRRGEGDIEALWLQLLGPFGFLNRIVRVETYTPAIQIIPSLPRVQRIALQHFGAWQYRGGVRLERMPGDGSEFDALEAYMPGHDLRSIDWKASARHQSLQVRRYRVERNQRIVFALDTGHLMSDPLDDLQRLDHSIHASLLLSYFALRAGDQVGLYSYADRPGIWMPPAGGVKNFQRLNHACATLNPKDIETNHVLGLHNLLSKLKRRTLVVVFGDFVDSTTAELMVETIEHLLLKHLVIFVTFDDPILEGALQKEPMNSDDVARALVANDLWTERRKVLQQLRKLGVHTVQGPPDLAAVRLVARYVEIKRRALIG
jgi:uncharacterized protein (DUF58 family)